jgi:hypothetical protein
MPKVGKAKLADFRELNALRRNLKNMTPADVDHYIQTGEIKPSKAKYKHGRGMY